MLRLMEHYTRRTFTADLRGGQQFTRDVYERGDGPPVVIIQELPGIGPQTLRLAERLVDAGYRAVLPHLFGPLGRVCLAGNLVRVMCMRREFDLLARNRSSPIVDWLRALCRDVRDRQQVRGVGVIGMCLTGNFALTLIGDDSVLAAVASQPSLPALHMSPDEVAAARAFLDTNGPMLALRFANDPLCSARTFNAIAATFNQDRQRVRLEVLPGWRHSVLTIDFVDREGHPTHAAFQSVLAYFAEHLAATAS
jgi:dienelactone hydrolase